jgi:hypothetical protein
MAARPPHRVTLDKEFAGVSAGAKLLISSPQDMEALLRTHTLPGDTPTDPGTAPKACNGAHRRRGLPGIDIHLPANRKRPFLHLCEARASSLRRT